MEGKPPLEIFWGDCIVSHTIIYCMLLVATLPPPPNNFYQASFDHILFCFVYVVQSGLVDPRQRLPTRQLQVLAIPDWHSQGGVGPDHLRARLAG